MSVVNKFIDSTNFLTATAVYDNINLTTKATDGYYQFGGQYRRQVSGSLLTATVCSDCFTFDSLDYVSTNSNDLCCLTQTASQYFYPTGLTFLTTTNIFTDVNLTTIAADGFYSEPNGSQFRQMSASSLGSITTCPSCATTLLLKYSSVDAFDLYCNPPSSVNYFVAFGQSFATASQIFTTDALVTVAADGYYKDAALSGSGYRIMASGSLGTIQSQVTCNTIFISGVGAACTTFCGATNYTIPLEKNTTNQHSFIEIQNGDVIAGATLTSGWYAYAATSTDTATGTYRQFQLDTNNTIIGIGLCSGSNCVIP